jgi:glycine/D-amino acid oxidase-like deaminating enzyme
MDELASHGLHPFTELSSEEAARLGGSPTHLGGVLESSTATVQPVLLALGLRRVALERGIEIYETSPMTSIDSGTPARVRTAQGTVTAEKVVLAMNAWSASFPEIRRRLLILGSDIVATPSIPEQLQHMQLDSGLAISDSRRLVHYYRTTLDGRLVFGKGGGRIGNRGNVDDGFAGRSRREQSVAAHLYRTYPQLHGMQPEASWTGAVDYSVTSMPFFAHLENRPEVVYGVGFSGNGVGPSYVGGHILSDLVLDRQSELSTSGLVHAPKRRLPPEPVRWLGGHAVRRALSRKERLEDAGRTPDRPTSLLASLDPTSFVG